MQWDRDKLLMELGQYSFNSEPRSGELEQYLSFYEFGFIKEVGASHRVGWVDASDFKVVLQTFSLEKSLGTVFIFHGYFDHAGIYHHLIEHALKKGFSVALYDMPGHGLSSGKRTSIANFEQYQQAMDAVLNVCHDIMPKPFHAVGQSTGGAVLIDRLSGNDCQPVFERVVLLAPLVRPKGWGGIKLLHSAVQPFFDVWKRSFGTNSSDTTFIEFLRKVDPLQSKHLSVDWIGALKDWVVSIEHRNAVNRRVLIVQGTADQTVEWLHNLQVIRRLFEQVSICMVEGAHHHLVNESVAVRGKVFSAIERELGVS